MSGVSYRDSGVDLEVYAESMRRLPRLLHRTFSPRVQPLDGGFAGLFQLDFPSPIFRRGYVDPVLVSCTDGVGTKLKVATMAGRNGTIGIDLVAMCVNDALCCGAEPLFFLDYVAMSHDDPRLLEEIVSGISDGCVQADCALLGGETAIMSDLYSRGDYDLAGFCVGVVEKKNVISGAAIAPQDVVIGVPSSGVHSNGYSLVRRIAFDRGKMKIDQYVPELAATVADALLVPTFIYCNPVRQVLQHYRVKQVVHGIAHITGGGLAENIARILHAGCGIDIDCRTWQAQPVFGWLQQMGQVDTDEMYRVFNMGIGLVLVVSPFYADSICRILQAGGHDARVIGAVRAGTGTVELHNRP